MAKRKQPAALPPLSHLQFAVLGALLHGDLAGREIRHRLGALRVRQTGPAFYQMMARLEDGGLVEGWYSQEIVGDQTVKERRYRVTGAGERAWRETRAFYLETIRDAEASEEVSLA